MAMLSSSMLPCSSLSSSLDMLHKCPYCLKEFSTPQDVTHHLNQPLRACCSWKDDLVTVMEVLEREQENLGPESSNVTFELLMEVDVVFDADPDPFNDAMGGEDYQPMTEDVHMMVDNFLEHQ